MIKAVAACLLFAFASVCLAQPPGGGGGFPFPPATPVPDWKVVYSHAPDGSALDGTVIGDLIDAVDSGADIKISVGDSNSRRYT